MPPGRLTKSGSRQSNAMPAGLQRSTTIKARQEHLSRLAARVALRQHPHPLLLALQLPLQLHLHSYRRLPLLPHRLQLLLRPLHHRHQPTPTATATPTPTPLFVADNFNRQDGGLGLNWTKPAASENNLVIFNGQVEVDVENSNNFAFWSANNFTDDQVLANCSHEDRVVAWRNRAGGRCSGPVLPRGCCGAERLSDLSKMGRWLFSVGHWNDGDVASGRCVNAGGNGKR